MLSVNLKGTTINQAIEQIKDSSGYYFAYAFDVPGKLNPAGLQNYEQVSLDQVLMELTKSTNVEFIYVKDQIVLRELPAIKKNEYLLGQVYEAESGRILPYATIELKGKKIGTVSNYKAYFKLNIREAGEYDTLLISSVGYQKKEMAFNQVDLNDSLKVFLSIKVIKMPSILISANKYLKSSVGGNAKKSQGEMYVDTHGQQTALFIENQQNLVGKIEKLRFFLSPKGNIHAPFRVHVYDMDSVTDAPGQDLINSFLVVQPDIIRGWYEIDVFEYDIDIPKNGFYVAFEGVFPNDSDYIIRNMDADSATLQGIKNKKDVIIRILSYGQRIGFRKSKKNETWHYSLSGKWFQLKKQSFNVMMGASLLIDSDQIE